MTYIEELRKAVGSRPVLLPSTGLLVIDPADRILLQLRSDDGTWGVPGGLLEIGEAPDEAVRREAREEMDLEIGEVELFDVFGGSDFFHDYPGQGRVYGVSAVYVTRDVAGSPRVDGSEVCEVRFFAPDELPENLEQTTRLILERYLERRERAGGGGHGSVGGG